MLLGVAGTIASDPALGAIDALSASLSRELGDVLTKLEKQQTDCAERLLTGQLLYGEAIDIADAVAREGLLASAAQVTQDAWDLAAVSANDGVRSQAEAMLAQIKAAASAVPSAQAATVFVSVRSRFCVNCGAPREDGRFCTNCGTPFAD
jgi:hypothetical protein